MTTAAYGGGRSADSCVDIHRTQHHRVDGRGSHRNLSAGSLELRQGGDPTATPAVAHKGRSGLVGIGTIKRSTPDK